MEQPQDDLMDFKIAALKEYVDLRIQALQAEYTKSEQNYPTRQQLNEETRTFITKSEYQNKHNDIANQVKLLFGLFTGLFLLFVAEYINK